MALIERSSRYLRPAAYGYDHYESWIESEEEILPGVSAEIRQCALEIVSNRKEALLASALQALACIGHAEDIEIVRRVQRSPGTSAVEAQAALAYLEHRMRPIETLLVEVTSRESFVTFARALAKDRTEAQKLERASPDRYVLDGANGWKNADIASFIFAGLGQFEGRSSTSEPSWRDFAEFLYLGKIVE
jgi:hypothetical protein